jgi:succinate-semialdehyde dehydrogenase / glutarate-semialdehyde dehydrogenase
MTEYAVRNPATGETLRECATLSGDALEAMIGRADAAHRPWSASDLGQRAMLLRRVGELHAERRAELAAIIGREMGKPVAQALGEVDFTAGIYAYYADRVAELLADEPIELLSGAGRAVVRRASLGPLLGIMPWNYPYYQVARFAAPNLAIGNPILLKHAPQCPESAATIQQLFDQAGFPVGCYQNLYASNAQIEAVIADPRVRGVSVTGSERAGAAVAEIAGRNLKKVVLELGGSDPFIVLDTGDLDRVVEAAVSARFSNAGQACNSAKRIIVLDGLYDDFLTRFVAAIGDLEPGDPTAPETRLGPLSSAPAAERLEQQVRQAVDRGATVLAGGRRDANFFEPTVLVDIARENPAAREEFFGPVAQVYRVASEGEAIDLANDTDFGLGSYVYTDDEEQASRVTDALDAGMVFVNLVGAEAAELPFGGVKRSGFGRELGRLGADEFVNKKLVRSV